MDTITTDELEKYVAMNKPPSWYMHKENYLAMWIPINIFSLFVVGFHVWVLKQNKYYGPLLE